MPRYGYAGGRGSSTASAFQSSRGGEKTSATTSRPAGGRVRRTGWDPADPAGPEVPLVVANPEELLRRDAREVVEYAHETATIASTITGTFNGDGPCPGADRAWRPASPQISTTRSLKPLTTFALSWKPGALWT